MMTFLSRLKEPSTWAGIGGLAVMFGLHGADVAHFQTIATAIPALLAIALPEASVK